MVVVYGTVCLDRFHAVPRLPEPGGYVEIDTEFEAIGGEAVNTAIALEQWGEEVALGGNSLGEPGARRLLEAAGLSAAFLPDGQHPAPVCDVYVTPDGQRTMFGRGFREMEGTGAPELVPLPAGAWLTVDGNHGRAGDRAVALAREAGLSVYVQDATSVPAGTFEVWQSSTDWVGAAGDPRGNACWLTSWTAERGGFGILSDGLSGFVAGGRWTDGAQLPVRAYPAFPCPRTVDSTGAGDTFRAGMLLGLVRGWPPSRCLQFAAAAASLNCRSLGANTGLPTVDEVWELCQGHPGVARAYG